LTAELNMAHGMNDVRECLICIKKTCVNSRLVN